MHCQPQRGFKVVSGLSMPVDYRQYKYHTGASLASDKHPDWYAAGICNLKGRPRPNVILRDGGKILTPLFEGQQFCGRRPRLLYATQIASTRRRRVQQWLMGYHPCLSPSAAQERSSASDSRISRCLPLVRLTLLGTSSIPAPER